MTIRLTHTHPKLKMEQIKENLEYYCFLSLLQNSSANPSLTLTFKITFLTCKIQMEGTLLLFISNMLITSYVGQICDTALWPGAPTDVISQALKQLLAMQDIVLTAHNEIYSVAEICKDWEEAKSMDTCFKTVVEYFEDMESLLGPVAFQDSKRYSKNVMSFHYLYMLQKWDMENTMKNMSYLALFSCIKNSCFSTNEK